jgi:Protein of unknown function (DUF3429)
MEPGAPSRIRACMEPQADSRSETVVERQRIPLDGLIFGYGAMMPFPLAAAAVWLGDAELGALAAAVATIWGGAILIFLAGVRRDLSFRTPGGPRPSQIAMMLWLFLAGLAALVLPPAPALWLLLAGFASLMALDPIAARRDEAPLYFARLRPPQMAIPVVSFGLIVVLLR